jgi:hypothetical protein
MCRCGGATSTPALGKDVDRSRFEQREARVGGAPQESPELGMVAYLAGENVVVRGSRGPDAVQSEAELRVELSPDDQPIVLFNHVAEDCTAHRALARVAGQSPG